MSELTPPRKPEPHECCGTGCIPCVMDIYEEELYEYEKALKKMAAEGGEASANLKASPAILPTYSTFDPV